MEITALFLAWQFSLRTIDDKSAGKGIACSSLSLAQVVYGSGATLTRQQLTILMLRRSSLITPMIRRPLTSNKPEAGASIFVQTDRNGVAQVYYQLGNATGAHQVTAALTRRSKRFLLPKRLMLTAVSGSRSASLVIVSGDNQRSDADTHDVEDPLVVRVRRPGGYRISNVIIRFTALIGALERRSWNKVRND